MELLELIGLLAGKTFEAMRGWVSASDFYKAALQEWKVLIESQALFLLGVSAVCGALIGTEREHAHKPAGLRTNMMICVGSTLFTLASIYSWQHLAGGSPTVDPGRIAAQVVSGVGFIGAGVILRTGLHITGITTASTIWLVAAIGMVVGLGFPLLGFIVALASAAALFFLGGIELHFGTKEE